MNSDVVAYMFAHQRDRIRIGIWITTAAAPMLAFVVTALSHQVRRIACGDSPLARAQLIAGACLIPDRSWLAANYRGERSPELIHMLNALARLPQVGVVGTARCRW